MIVFASGCAVHYYDKETGTEHLWGFGHLRMKAEPSNDAVVRLVVTGTVRPWGSVCRPVRRIGASAWVTTIERR